MLVTQCSLGDNAPPSLPTATALARARAAWSSSHRTAAAFLASPLVTGSVRGGPEQLSFRGPRLDDTTPISAALQQYKPRPPPPQQQQQLQQQQRQHQQLQWRDDATVPGTIITMPTAIPTASASAAAAYSSIGSSSRPQFTCWSKDQWTPRSELSLSSGQHRSRQHRQRSTRLTTWSKCQWDPSDRPAAGFLDPHGTTTARLRGDAGGGRGRGGWSKSQWSPREWHAAEWSGTGSSSALDSTRFGGEGGGGGAGVEVSAAGAGGSGGGGGAFARSSLSSPTGPGAASLGGGRGSASYRGPTAATVSRPAVAAAAVGSMGPKDLSNAPVEVRGWQRQRREGLSGWGGGGLQNRS